MTTTIYNPRMKFQYFYLDNGRYRQTSLGMRYFPARVMHYAETLQEAISEARKMTCGKRIEIHRRYGLHIPVAIVEPDGTVH